MRILFVGTTGTYHLGAYFHKAADELGLDAHMIDARAAFDAPRWWLRVNWHLLGHRPPNLRTFSKEVLATGQRLQPDLVIFVGFAPITLQALQALRTQGIRCATYLADDPWNAVHRSRRVLSMLPYYDHIFTPRQANLAQLRALGVPTSYLPFAYQPEHHFIERPPAADANRYNCDLMFYGGGDHDRLAIIEPLIEAGFRVRLYGGYWERFPHMRPHAHGIVVGSALRHAVACAKVSLCLVRSANRDGHVMRTYEVPAMGGCMLTEDTAEHRAILGDEGEETTRYFTTAQQAIEQLHRLLADAPQRQRLAERAHARITSEPNTYQDRLKTLLDQVNQRTT